MIRRILQKLLIKDPRIGTPKRKTDSYVLREEPILPEQEILEEFQSNQMSTLIESVERHRQAVRDF